MIEPNFFIVGAPKCGTTAMSAYLAEHPEAFLPSVKEPHFFGSDLTPTAFSGRQRAYLRLFEPSSPQHSVRGEASTWYLYSTRAAQEIHAFAPDARILIMLRDPLDVIHSLHNQNVFSGAEPIEDFDAAMEATLSGSRSAAVGVRREALDYLEAVHFAPQVQRYFDVFGRDRVHVILFDRFASNTLQVTSEAFAFLKIDPSFEPAIGIRNASKRPRSRAVNRLMSVLKASSAARTVARSALPAPTRNRLQRAVRRLNAAPATRPEMNVRTRGILAERLAPGIAQLETVLETRLPGWASASKGARPLIVDRVEQRP